MCSPYGSNSPASVHSLFERLYNEEFDFVCRTVRRYGVQSQDVADLTQEVFTVVYHRISMYDATRPAKSWLYAFAIHLASDYCCLVRHQREISCGVPPELVLDEPSAEQIMVASEEHKIALQALDRLQPDLRAVLLLHDVEEKTMPEIVAALGIPLNTGYTKLRRAREQVRRNATRTVKANHRKDRGRLPRTPCPLSKGLSRSVAKVA
jgi:RNA polymerase sigma-70 factor (ECF subfamily)